jgi:integrase
MDELRPYLDAYIADFRPVLLSRRCDDQPEDALWLSWSGRPLNNVAVQTAFKNATTEVQGWPANPHSFRHSAATILMRLDVRMVELAAQVLAHRGLDTVRGHYDLSKNDAADRQWRELRNRYISPQGDSP